VRRSYGILLEYEKARQDFGSVGVGRAVIVIFILRNRV